MIALGQSRLKAGDAARLREKALKSGQGRAWLKARIKAKPPGC